MLGLFVMITLYYTKQFVVQCFFYFTLTKPYDPVCLDLLFFVLTQILPTM